MRRKFKLSSLNYIFMKHFCFLVEILEISDVIGIRGVYNTMYDEIFILFLHFVFGGYKVFRFLDMLLLFYNRLFFSSCYVFLIIVFVGFFSMVSFLILFDIVCCKRMGRILLFVTNPYFSRLLMF